MRTISRHRATRLLVLIGVSATSFAAPPPRSVSTSRQFIVYGRDAQLRAAICDLAERTKKNALALLEIADGWTTPVVVHAQSPQADLPEMPPARLKISQTGFGLKLQLDLQIGADVRAPQVERELLRASLLEMAYRQEPHTPAGTAYVEPPDWLLEGMIALGSLGGSPAITEALAAATASGKVVSLQQILGQNPALLDSPSRALYRAYCAAVISMLIESPEGRRRLGDYVTGLPRASNDPEADLLIHFPALGSRGELEKTWTLSVSRLAARRAYGFFGTEETERELAKILRVELEEQSQRVVYSLEEFRVFLPKPGSRAALQQPARELLLLSARANPLYRKVIAEYQDIIMRLTRGKTKKVTTRLVEARSAREQLSRRMSAIDDYMNWFEATQATNASGMFGEYMKAAELAGEAEPRRRDPISVYLDALESQFGK